MTNSKEKAKSRFEDLPDSNQIDHMKRWLKLFIEPGQVTELRALKVQWRNSYDRSHTESGFFYYEHLHEMAKKAHALGQVSRGVYFTPNPLNPDVLARRQNRIDRADDGELSKDKDVLARRWLLIDCDPVRDAHVSSSKEEKKKARETAEAIRSYLGTSGWPRPIFADSGNGYHLLYRIDLPTDDEGIVKRCLESLAKVYDDEHVKIDQAVFNPARICKLYGTPSRKGDSTTTRPHRQSKILEIPSHE